MDDQLLFSYRFLNFLGALRARFWGWCQVYRSDKWAVGTPPKSLGSVGPRGLMVILTRPPLGVRLPASLAPP